MYLPLEIYFQYDMISKFYNTLTQLSVFRKRETNHPLAR
jgi:hypothetical protein